MDQISRTIVDGVAFDALTEDDAVSRITRSAVDGWGGFVLTPNANILRQLRTVEHVELAASADFVLADGMPIVWASRVAGSPLPERVTGSSLIWTLSEAAAAQGLPVLLLGGSAGVAERGAQILTSAYPAIDASWHFPPFGFERDQAEMDAIILAVYESNAKIVFVGLGFPKQERLILRLRHHFPDVWFVACGAALTFVAGEISRAPQWMQDRGVEWVHRLVNEPRRLARRYLLEDLPFALAMFARALWLRGAVLAHGLATPGTAGSLTGPAVIRPHHRGQTPVPAAAPPRATFAGRPQQQPPAYSRPGARTMQGGSADAERAAS